MTDSERVDHMATALEGVSLEDRKALEREKSKKRIQEEIEKIHIAQEQGKKVEELLKDIAETEREKKQSSCLK